MMRRAALSNRRIVSIPVPARPPAIPRTSSSQRAESSGELATRPAIAADLPWLQSWAAHLRLPAPRSRHVRSFILLKNSERVGYLAVREDTIDTQRGREPIVWVISAFLVPSLRGQGLILKFGEMLSREYYQHGIVGCRVASDNARMLRLVSKSGWKKLHSTRRYTDFILELDSPFQATRGT